jgi:hypothetical protein
MIDLGAAEIELPCPYCNFCNTVLIKQIKSGEMIICSGCKRDIDLTQYSNNISETEREMDDALSALQEKLKKGINLNIKF